jgi:hypothetical protein
MLNPTLHPAPRGVSFSGRFFTQPMRFPSPLIPPFQGIYGIDQRARPPQLYPKPNRSHDPDTRTAPRMSLKTRANPSAIRRNAGPAFANGGAVSLNVTAVPIDDEPVGYVTVWGTSPTEPQTPTISTLNVPTGEVTANASIVTLNPSMSGSVSVYATSNKIPITHASSNS